MKTLTSFKLLVAVWFIISMLYSFGETNLSAIARVYSDSKGRPIGLIYYKRGEVVAKQIFHKDRIELIGAIPDGIIKLYDLDNNEIARLNYLAGELQVSQVLVEK
ncbi:hypothetical protein OAR19_00750 [bacterium]|nr:hypothetical protein [bacterium]